MVDNVPTFTINDAKDVPKADRKPRTTPVRETKTTAPATPAEVKKALATLDSAYNMIATGLLMFGLNDTLAAWQESAGQLQATNEDALKASPKLAKWIANVGSTGGAATFILTHGLAFATVARVATSELTARREANEAAQRTAPQFTTAQDTDRDPTLIPGS